MVNSISYRNSEKYKKMKRESDKRYYKKNKAKIISYQKEYLSKPENKLRHHKNEQKEERKKQRHEYRMQKREKIKEYNKQYRNKNQEILKLKRKVIYEQNKDKEIRKVRAYQKRNQDKINKTRLKRHKIRWHEDKEYKIRLLLRNNLGHALNKYTSLGKIMSSKKYGIDYKAIIGHLKPFPDDTSKYHIDHIKPLCSFDLTDPEQVKIAFAPENHRWLSPEENLSKASQDKKSKNAK